MPVSPIPTRDNTDFNIAGDVNSLQDQIGDIFKIIDEFGDFIADAGPPDHIKINAKDITSAFKTLKDKIWRTPTRTFTISSIVTSGGGSEIQITTSAEHSFEVNERVVISNTGVTDYDDNGEGSFGTVVSTTTPLLVVDITHAGNIINPEASISTIGAKIQQHGDVLIPRGVVFFIFGADFGVPNQGGLNECPAGYMELNDNLNGDFPTTYTVGDSSSVISYFGRVNEASGLDSDNLPDFVDFFLRGHRTNDSLHNSIPSGLEFTGDLGNQAGIHTHRHDIAHTHNFEHFHEHTHFVKHRHELPIHRHKIPLHTHLLGKFTHLHGIVIGDSDSAMLNTNIGTKTKNSNSYDFDPTPVFTHGHTLKAASTSSKSHSETTLSGAADNRGFTDNSEVTDLTFNAMGSEGGEPTEGVTPATPDNPTSEQPDTSDSADATDVFPAYQYVKLCMKI